MFLDPIIIRVALMEKQELADTCRKYRALVRAARWQFWRLWIPHRIGELIVVGFMFYLIAGAFTQWFDPSRYAFGWEGVVGGLLFFAVYWLFYTNSRLNALYGKWRNEERKARETLEMHLHTLGHIRRRSRALVKQTGA